MSCKARMVLTSAVLALAFIGFLQANSTFMPDSVFKGTALTGWHTLGQASWQAQNGELVGNAKGGSGWLVLDKSYQDVALHAYMKVSGGATTGVLLRAEKTAQGMKGVFVTLADGRLALFAVTLDGQGKELTRTPLDPASSWYRNREQATAGRGGSTAGRGAGPGGAGAAGAAGRGVAPGGAPGGAQGAARGAAPGGAPGAGRGAAPGGAPGAGRGQAVALPVAPPDTSYKAGEWNELEIILESGYLRSNLNMGRESAGYADDELGSFGPVALYAGGEGEVRFKEVAYKDLGVRTWPAEQVSPNFRMQRINGMYYSWTAGAADFNKDGAMDIVAGPYIYFGPNFNKSRELYTVTALKPSTEFAYAHCDYTFDFNGDGWPDILAAPPGGSLFINPKGESRRWARYAVVPNFQSEESMMGDVDGDGRPELVVAANSAVGYYQYDPADPTKQWTWHAVSERGYGSAHGIGFGDVNGDGKVDILNCYGWWEQPKSGPGEGTWTYHPEAFGWYSRGAYGGVDMFVYDVNGDKLNDVVTVMSAHGFGLAWFEQKRDKDGKISFVQHPIMEGQGYGAKAAGNVIFSEAHGATIGDVNGDGIPDFIVGKRYWTHLDSYLDPDPYGPPVLYAYRTVRNPKAPGGAEFVPELIHNRSGAGSDVLAVDLNKDGALDIVTSTNTGTYVFWGKPRGKAGAAAAAAKK